MDFGLVVEALTGDVEVAPGYQLIKVRRTKPETPQIVTGATWRSATGPFQERQVFTATEYFWIIPGLFARIKSGGTETPGYFQASLVVSKVQCGGIVGQRQFELYPRESNSLHKLVTVSRFVPAMAIDKFRGIVVATGCNDIDVSWFCRSAIDEEKPNAWQQIGSWTSLSDGNNEINTGSSGTDLSMPAGANLTTNSLVQIGFGGRMTDQGSDPHGFFRVAAGLLYT